MFITFEGIEGSGKTTQIQTAARYLKKMERDVILTREPGSTGIGARIRAILLDPAHKGMDHLTELLLYMADRAQHVRSVVRPALAEGKVVLCDRYFDATLAYQGYARGLDIGLIKGLHQQVLDDFKPDMTILLDLPPEKGLDRAWRAIRSGGRDGAETRFEEERLNFHQRVREGYLEIARLEPERFRVIDADDNVDRVHEKIIHVLSDIC
jgi:dTMP kinase